MKALTPFNEQRLKQILSSMDIPEYRRDLEAGNVAWLVRNLPFRNSNHSNFYNAMAMLEHLNSHNGYNDKNCPFCQEPENDEHLSS